MQGDFQRFLQCLFYKNIKRNQGYFNYIVETCDMEPEQAKELFDREDTVILYIGVPRQDTKMHINQLKKYQTEKDWTYNRTEEQLLKHSEYWTNKSREFEKKCKELGIMFVDTSTDRERVLNETMEYLEKVLT